MLALAVVKPGGGARLLNEDNSADPGGWVSIEDAAESGRAFFVDLKDTLTAFDLDTPELVASGELLASWASAQGLPVLVASSGRLGHRHLYVRCDDRALVEAEALSLGIPKSALRRSIRPPLAPHRKGLMTALISPVRVDDALEVLGPSEYVEPRRKNLPPWLMTLISEGDSDNRYAGRSPMALAVASGLRACGYDYATYRVVMANNPCGAKYHALLAGEGTENPESFLARTWEKAASQLSPAEILKRISEIRVAVEAADWPGRTGTTDRAVMLALCELGTASGTTALTFGSRKIAEVAQLEDRTVRGALSRLVDARWLERSHAVQAGDADTYRFGSKLDRMTALIPSPPIGDKCGNYDQSERDRVLLHPVFRNGSGLGKNTGRTWLVLGGLGRPVTTKELAEVRRADRRTVDRHLKVLEKHGLAAKSGTQWTASGDGWRLDELAVALGAAKRSEMQSERYRRNRDGYFMARRLKDARLASTAGASAVAGSPSGQSSDYDEADGIERLTEEKFRRWYEEQLLLDHLGLPNELI
ncbi:helix-turn-helix transcriptional regulator [Mycobacterium barrassiae]|uniref:helix-turn-helix domain-containing protein n=1 Tax=Mycobacterium barrassiae TaxID=319709 RepID=UPI002265D19F|nr:helix-turn-helix domain-containing protein [Mycobacterium barrassiae]MCV7299774.1 helix-turn-helix transcriptional regulator [Mycobacterium barrassiae]